MRLFVGISLSGAARDALEETAAALGKRVRGNFARRDMYHITLAFLGETPRESLELLRKLLDSAAAGVSRFDVTLSRLDYFGQPRSALIYCAAEPSAALNGCAEKVRGALDGDGIPYDRKPFKPHVTLARKVDAEKALPQPVPRTTFTANGITLYHSDRINGVLTYTPIHFAAFGGIDEA